MRACSGKAGKSEEIARMAPRQVQFATRRVQLQETLKLERQSCRVERLGEIEKQRRLALRLQRESHQDLLVLQVVQVERELIQVLVERSAAFVFTWRRSRVDGSDHHTHLDVSVQCHAEFISLRFDVVFAAQDQRAT